MTVQVRRRDAAAGEYRLETTQGAALVPECLMASDPRPSHEETHEWIAAHRIALDKAVRALARGQAPRPPHDIVTLSSSV